jgi:LAO/AO transport system kinase
MDDGPHHESGESALRVQPGVAPSQRRVVPPRRAPEATVEELVAGIRCGDRALLGRALTLVESSRPDHRRKAGELLSALAPWTGRAHRVGISGIPGVGKSTFIEALGMLLVERGQRVAVLAIDPSSDLSGGSILGDKTRMERLARHPSALVRPTPCGGWLGGVARGTRESILVCEAAGMDVVFVETVGVGQSETQVASMVDFFLLLMVAGAGDELQGIKRGIMELADGLVVNKADGDNVGPANLAAAQYRSALGLLRPTTPGWMTRVQTCSAVTGEGIEAVWEMIAEHRHVLESAGQLDEKRRRQALYWMKQSVEHLLVDSFYRNAKVAACLEETQRQVMAGEVSPFVAAERLVALATGGAAAQEIGQE